jgi:hypothetical protein
MKLHFPWPEVAKILDEVRAATVVKPLYDHVTGKGLWLVGDEGVYLMPNTAGETRTIAYAKECDPKKVDGWWEVKRASFGSDDGVEFISLSEIDGLLIPAKTGTQPEQLIIDLSPQRFVITVQWKQTSKKGRAA